MIEVEQKETNKPSIAMSYFIEPWEIDVNTVSVTGASSRAIILPFELTAKDFLEFAQNDLKGQSMTDTVNALSNIKRAIHCVFDSLLFAANFLEYSRRKRWTFPKKMNFLSEIGIIAPHILTRINLTRNLLEHEFKKPDRKDIEIAYDVSNLLYYATVRFTKRVYEMLEVSTADGKTLLISINTKKREITVSSDSQSISVSWDTGSEGYKRWLKLTYRVLSFCV